MDGSGTVEGGGWGKYEGEWVTQRKSDVVSVTITPVLGQARNPCFAFP